MEQQETILTLPIDLEPEEVNEKNVRATLKHHQTLFEEYERKRTIALNLHDWNEHEKQEKKCTETRENIEHISFILCNFSEQQFLDNHYNCKLIYQHMLEFDLFEATEEYQYLDILNSYSSTSYNPTVYTGKKELLDYLPECSYHTYKGPKLTMKNTLKEIEEALEECLEDSCHKYSFFQVGNTTTLVVGSFE